MNINASSSRAPAGRPAAERSHRQQVDLRVLRQLTPRDRMLLDLVAEQQVFTTGQLSRIAFDSDARAQHRLLTLYRLGVFDRFRWCLPAGSQAWHYTLGHTGAAIVAAARGVDPPAPAVLRNRAIRLATSPRLAHLLGVNDFFTALLADARRRPECELVRWWSERRSATEFDHLARPDGHGIWRDGQQQISFFLEYDTGTEPLPRLVDKLGGYGDLATAGGPNGPVLFHLPGPRREAGLHRLITQTSPAARIATTSNDLATELGITAAVWLLHAGATRTRLITL